jgi:hypothetical protein
MELWYPPDDQAPLYEWWAPLVLAAAAGRREQVPWSIHLDEFALQGRVDRGGRPAVWVYLHRASGQELYLDDTGQAYKFTRTPNGRSLGRFTKLGIRSAIHAAGLPRHVEPVWYDEPPMPTRWSDPQPRYGDGADEWSATPAGHASSHQPAGAPTADLAASARPRRRPRAGARRGHLTLIHGGRQPA